MPKNDPAARPNPPSEKPGSKTKPMADQEAPAFAYLGTRACGCFALAAVDQPGVLLETAQEVMEILRAGGRVERLHLEKVKTRVASLSSQCEACRE